MAIFITPSELKKSSKLKKYLSDVDYKSLPGLETRTGVDLYGLRFHFKEKTVKKREMKKYIAHLEEKVKMLEDEMYVIYYLSERARQNYLTINGISTLMNLKEEMAKCLNKAMADIPFCGDIINLKSSGLLVHHDALNRACIFYDLEPEDVCFILNH